MNRSSLEQLAAMRQSNRTQPKETLSVVLSFRNEQNVLEELIGRLRSVLSGQIEKGRLKDFELIFVNDASTDRSRQILEKAAQASRDIRILNMSRNFGVSPCVLAGMEFASGDAVVYMDADLQDPPEVIPELIEAWQDHNADVVHTVRLSRAGESRIKLWITRIGYKVIRFVSEVPLLVEAGDFKLLSRRSVDHLIKLREKRPYVRGLATWIGFNQTTISYNRHARAGGNTKFPIFDRRVIRNFLNSALISFSDVPLKFSLLCGFVVSFIAFALLIYVILQRIFVETTSGWSALMVTMLLLGGIQLVTIGILGLYLNSVYLETKGRPNYLIESAYGFENVLNNDSPSPQPTKNEQTQDEQRERVPPPQVSCEAETIASEEQAESFP